MYLLYIIIELNVRAVTERFNGIAAKYYQFGSNLKILPGELDGIRNEVSIHDLLHDVVHEFLTSSRENFKPTWRTIVGAVFDINRALAEEIAKEHTGRFVVIQSQKQRWKFHTKIGVFILYHIAPGF